MKILLCVPTFNAANTADHFLAALSNQTLSGFDRLVIDSESHDETKELFVAAGFRFHQISREKFDHGATRKLASNFDSGFDVIIFLTQDAFLANPTSLQKLVEAFNDPLVGAAFGRQLPNENSNTIAAHARLFNYPPESRVKTSNDIPEMGLKTTFISNSFAAYRCSALAAVGGFPDRCIVSEDTYVAARMILGGWKIAYCADAQVYHFHNYNWRQEFKRYFDIGVFHAREPWIRKAFGRTEGEGGRFVKSEIHYLCHREPYLIPSAIVRTCIKYFGFRVGLSEKFLPSKIKKRISMQKAYWDQELLENCDA